MVESLNQQTSQYRSLSADSELSSGYELLYKGEYTQCARIIRKKYPKLKSPIDKANFNILKLLLLNRTKKSKEKAALLEQLKKEFLTNPELINSEQLTKHFKNILRNFDDEKGAQEIFKTQLKNRNLNGLDSNEQNEILKELTLNLEFTDIYSKVNTFIKNPNDANVEFLKLIKYEIVYYLFLNKKLSEKMTRKIYEELLNNYDTLKKEKGYFDIVGQYSLALNDKDKFIEIFTQKKKEEEFTNVPIEDIKYDIYLGQEKVSEIINELYLNIKNNIDKCNFTSFERIVNVFFWYIKKNGIKIDSSKVSPLKENTVEKVSDIKTQAENVVNEIMGLFEHIKVQSGRNLNAFKSGVYGQLMVYHNIIIMNKNMPAEFTKSINELIISVLDKAITKQSILFEMGKYFIYLDEENRKNLMQHFGSKYNIDLNSFEAKDITKENFDSFLLMQKIQKLLFAVPKDKIKDKIYYLIGCYLLIVNTITKDTKLEKGERNIADDLIILANEYYYETYNNENKDTNLAFVLLFINSFSHLQSPYNYDISYYLLQTNAHLNLNNDTLDILKYMNLKGPQFETVSYIAFKPFLNYKNGLNYLVDNSERWQNDNRRNTKKTLWKMFTGRNFWNSQELLEFLNENKNSYYTILLQFFDVILGASDNYLNQNGIDEEAEKDYFDFLLNLYNDFEARKKDNKLTKNQDMFVSIHKYRYENYAYFNNNFDILTKNENYSRDSYRCEIDSLNKNDNCLYKLYPGYKNNYIKECDCKPFGQYDSYEYLTMRLLSMVTLSYIENKEQLKIFNEKYLQSSKAVNSQLDIILAELTEKMMISLDSVEAFTSNQNAIFELYTKFDDIVIAKLKELKSSIQYNQLAKVSDLVSFFNEMKYFYFVNFTNITSKFIDFITQHKKELDDPMGLKAKFNEKYKSPLINSLRDLAKSLDNLIQNVHKNGFEVCKGGQLIKESGVISVQDEAFISTILKKGDDLKYQIEESNKDIFKEIKDFCKRIEDYIKQKI